MIYGLCFMKYGNARQTALSLVLIGALATSGLASHTLCPCCRPSAKTQAAMPDSGSTGCGCALQVPYTEDKECSCTLSRGNELPAQFLPLKRAILIRPSPLPMMPVMVSTCPLCVVAPMARAFHDGRLGYFKVSAEALLCRFLC